MSEPMATLLPPDALAETRVGISVSGSADLARLGLLESHFRLTLGEITRTVVTAGGGLVYGGHILPDGYTAFIAAELQRYSRRDRPLLICLPWQKHRELALPELRRFQERLGLFGRLVCLDPDGAEVDPAHGRGDAPVPVEGADLCRRALTSMRLYMRQHQHARVLLGGRREGFSGAMPGIMEEALLTLEVGQPLYLAGGFGGVTADIVRALQVDEGAWMPPASPEPADSRYADGYARLLEFAGSDAWRGLHNGLSADENRKLAATHRPGEIAALVALGLGRHTRAGRDND